MKFCERFLSSLFTFTKQVSANWIFGIFHNFKPFYINFVFNVTQFYYTFAEFYVEIKITKIVLRSASRIIGSEGIIKLREGIVNVFFCIYLFIFFRCYSSDIFYSSLNHLKLYVGILHIMVEIAYISHNIISYKWCKRNRKIKDHRILFVVVTLIVIVYM